MTNQNPPNEYNAHQGHPQGQLNGAYGQPATGQWHAQPTQGYEASKGPQPTGTQNYGQAGGQPPASHQQDGPQPDTANPAGGYGQQNQAQPQQWNNQPGQSYQPNHGQHDQGQYQQWNNQPGPGQPQQWNQGQAQQWNNQPGQNNGWGGPQNQWNQPYAQQGYGYGGFQPRGFSANTLFSDPDQRWPLIAAIASLLVIIGSFGAWVTFMGESAAGTNGDGKLTLILAILGIVLSGLYLFLPAFRGKIAAPIIGIVVSAVTAIIPLFTYSNLGDVQYQGYGDGPGAGWGVILVTIAAIVMIIMWVMHLLHLLKVNKQHRGY